MERSSMRCQRCHKTKNLQKTSSRVYNGKKYIYYMCRSCNTERCKKYRETEKGRKIVYRNVYASISRNRAKQNARLLLNWYVKVGKIIKPKSCACGQLKVEGHHEDHAKPLMVKWLCRTCHANLHRKLKRNVLKL